MSLAWSSVKALSIPVGGVSRDVKRVAVGGVTLWEKAPALPYDAEVEYIESTRTQWIDTGFVPNTKTVWKSVLTNLTSGIGVETLGHRFRIERNGSTWRGAIQNRPGAVGTWDNGTHTHILSASGNSYMVDSLSVSINAVLSTTESIYLFARNDNGSAVKVSLRLHSSQIYDNGALVRDYIPVRVGSGANAVGYLYDRANPTGGPLGNGLYPNAGSGAFVVGPDKTN